MHGKIAWIFLCSLLASSAIAAAPLQDRSQQPDALLSRINQVRAQEALRPLTDRAELREAAQAHAQDIAGRGVLDHRGSDGSKLSDRLHRVHYDYSIAAENLADGTVDAAATVSLWMQSPGHRANLLLPDVREVGIGHVQISDPRYPGGEHDYWVLVLGRRLIR